MALVLTKRTLVVALLLVVCFARFALAEEPVADKPSAEKAEAVEHQPLYVVAEEFVANCVHMLRLGVETLGALVIFAGVIVMLQRTVEGLRNPTPDLHERLRLTLARFMAVALEIQLGGDILTTAIAPTWDQIGKLGAIAVIRTVLNHFLSKEMQEAEHLGLGRPAHHGPAAHAPPPAPPAPPAPQAHPA